MIEFKNVSKVYGEKKALKELNLTIQQGEIFGLLGHNGAGKSTAIKSLVSIIQPTNGTITVDNLDLGTERMVIKRKIGYVPDTPDIFLQLTAGEYWNLMAAAYDVPQAEKENRLVHLAQLFDMFSHQDETISSFLMECVKKQLLLVLYYLILIFGF